MDGIGCQKRFLAGDQNALSLRSNGFRRTLDWRIRVAVVVALATIYLPTLGSFGFYDCWEAYYSEVSRQFFENGDYMSPRWHNGRGPDGWEEDHFWTKPVGSFWLQAIALRLTGAISGITLAEHGRHAYDDIGNHQQPSSVFHQLSDPGQVLSDKHIEGVMRLPSALLGIIALYVLFTTVWLIWGLGSALCVGVCLATAPMFFLIARQAITDMPYVGFLTIGICFLMRALFLSPQGVQIPPRKKQRRSLIGYLAIVLFFLLFLAQQLVLYRSLSQVVSFYIGSYVVSSLLFTMFYACIAVVCIGLMIRRQTQAEIDLNLFYICIALSGLCKGLVGALQPGLIVLVYLMMTADWRILRQLSLFRGILISSVLFFPWVHAMCVTYGFQFFDQLFGVEQMQRISYGEQLQARGMWTYYLHQYLVAFFPWAGFFPAAFARLFWRLRRATLVRSDRVRAELFLFAWFLGPFALFTLSRAKYHHYLLPLLVPAACLVGLYLHRLRQTRSMSVPLWISFCLVCVSALLLYQQPHHWVWLFTWRYDAPWDQGAIVGSWYYIYLAVMLLLCTVWVCVSAFNLKRRFIQSILFFAALTVGITALTRYQIDTSVNWSQKALFKTYYRKRRGPDELLVSWRLRWRGETWYSAAQTIVSNRQENTAIVEFLMGRQGQRVFFLTERSRLGRLKKMLPTEASQRTFVVEDESNSHYILASAVM